MSLRRTAAGIGATLAMALGCVGFVTAAGARTHIVVPTGWKTYRYEYMAISAPADWEVWVKGGNCIPPTKAPGVLVLGLMPGGGASTCGAERGARNVVTVADVPTGEYAAGPYAKAHIKVNGIEVYVMKSGPGSLVWITPGTEEISGSGPQASRVLHTIQPD